MEGDHFTGFAQRKIRVQRCTLDRPVLAGGEDYCKSTGRNGGANRKGPQSRNGGVIAQMCPAHRQREGVGIEEFDPVGLAAILICQASAVVCHDFIDPRGHLRGIHRDEQGCGDRPRRIAGR